ncbi:hypothetical protein TeGR_g5730 [Tetraparma gracilis]|uniref:MORN repeat-containing protein 5 n=1 Tax=Tetraparma gracilis TaxID=2962635 RepID=A0ABQ6MH15_9STRA|nr:hypothetical protein TeGR_g5730 [Tetraparma gracilis]
MEYSNSKYEGDTANGRFADEAGTYSYPDGTKFVGSLVNGEFHGEGKLILKGRGEFRGVWEKGRVVSGAYYWDDDLAYKEKDWKYCSEAGGDRTFHSENDSGIGGAGDVKFSDKHGRGESLKDGCYDAGDGYYDVRDGLVHIYPDAPSAEEQKEAKDEAEKEQVPDRTREPTEEEKKWVLAKGHTTLNTAMGKPLEDEGELGF